MLVESVSAVCQLVLALGCSLSATRDVVRQSKKCRRAMYNDFMVVPGAGCDKISLFW